MSQINLVPEIKIEQQKLNKINKYVTSTVTIVSIVVGAVIFLLISTNIYQGQRINNLNKNTAKIEDELKAYSDVEETITSLESGINGIKNVLSSDKKWSLFFDEIEKAMPADTRFLALKINGNSIKAVVQGNDVNSIDRFIQSFDSYKTKDGKKLFSGIVVTGYSKDDKGKITFESQFNLIEGVLW